MGKNKCLGISPMNEHRATYSDNNGIDLVFHLKLKLYLEILSHTLASDVTCLLFKTTRSNGQSRARKDPDWTPTPPLTLC